ncbi:MAG: Addiction module toxin RelE [Phycisphaerales bacterium]|nr:Addiction module toxin RelE [Phycisphaerales bacterium]
MPRRYDVRITKTASSELVEIHQFIERDSPQNASEMIGRLFESIEALDILPYRYKVHQSSKYPEGIIRSMPVPPYVVYYRVLEEAHVVRILTVRHGARRKPRRFD